MCLLAIYYRMLPEAPLLMAANREEAFDRPALPPRITRARAGSRRQQEGASNAGPGNEPCRVLCGIDQRAGGTWLGVNEYGLVVVVTNRAKVSPPPAPRSRGLLCLDLLACRTAAEASETALSELAGGNYAGANYLCADAASASVVHGGDRLEMVALEPGAHLLTSGDVNDAHDPRLVLARRLFDEQAIDSPAAFIDAAKRVCAYRGTPGEPTIVLRSQRGGTVSSTIAVLPARRAEGVYLYAAGPPDLAPHDDYSHLLRELGTATRP